MVATRSGRAAPADDQPQEQPDQDTFLDDLAKEMLKEITAETPVETETTAAQNNVDSIQLSAFRWKPETRLPILSKDTVPALKRDPKEGMAKKLTLPPLTGKRSIRAAREGIPDTSGKKWYNMPAPQITEEVKRDLRMLRLRSAFDPKSFYKKLDSTKFPKYFQMGTVVETSADFYSSRLAKSQRKQSFAEEIASDPHLQEVREKRYQKMQNENQRFSKMPNKKKTRQPKVQKKKPRRPKH